MKVFSQSLQQLEAVLDRSRDRQAVLSSNVANVDTPGFRAQDVDPSVFAATLGVAMARTESGHLQGAPASGLAAAVETADDQPAREDGNTVSLERQMAKLEENKVRFGAASSIVSRHLALLRYAATDGHG